MKVKIIGAGSIGNHLAQAARRMNWEVVVVDRDKKALNRMKDEIYPSRYGAWDPEISLFESINEPKGDFDVIMVGTPPDVRMRVALEALKEEPRILQLEKPIATPFDTSLKKFASRYQKQKKTIALVGYDHAVAESIQYIVTLLQEKVIGNAVTLDVEFREHWEGIFKAHPWLLGPQDTYLGFWKRGGGASGEHSHALHLWQYLARVAGLGEWKYVAPLLKLERRGKAEYDSVASFSIETQKGAVGRVVQDVVTKPTRKWIRIQGTAGFIEWICGGHPDGDLVRVSREFNEVKEEVFKKKRPDDFYREMLHIQDILEGKVKRNKSPISFESGFSVMKLIDTVWKKNREKKILLS